MDTTDGSDLFTDEHDLIFLFEPLTGVPDLSQTSVRKLLRWDVRLLDTHLLCAYNYYCVHIQGIDNE